MFDVLYLPYFYYIYIYILDLLAKLIICNLQPTRNKYDKKLYHFVYVGGEMINGGSQIRATVLGGFWGRFVNDNVERYEDSCDSIVMDSKILE